MVRVLLRGSELANDLLLRFRLTQSLKYPRLIHKLSSFTTINIYEQENRTVTRKGENIRRFRVPWEEGKKRTETKDVKGS